MVVRIIELSDRSKTEEEKLAPVTDRATKNRKTENRKVRWIFAQSAATLLLLLFYPSIAPSWLICFLSEQLSQVTFDVWARVCVRACGSVCACVYIWVSDCMRLWLCECALRTYTRMCVRVWMHVWVPDVCLRVCVCERAWVGERVRDNEWLRITFWRGTNNDEEDEEISINCKMF